MGYFVYMVRSREGYKYTGMTESLERRIEEHNSHSLSFWTKRGTAWKLIYSEEFATKSEALRREKWLKTGVGREFLKSVPEKL
jgi:putative endonuclease